MRTITLNGKHYEIHYGQNAICALEDALDTPVHKFLEKTFTTGMGFREIRALLWAGMLAKHRSMTIEAAGDLLDIESDRIMEIAAECDKEFASGFKKFVKLPDADDAQEDDSKNA
jgi:hypothetical protein